MNLRKVDLNLLVYFDALLQTRHVSRAAERLGVGQSAMSAALGRLMRLVEANGHALGWGPGGCVPGPVAARTPSERVWRVQGEDRA